MIAPPDALADSSMSREWSEGKIANKINAEPQQCSCFYKYISFCSIYILVMILYLLLETHKIA